MSLAAVLGGLHLFLMLHLLRSSATLSLALLLSLGCDSSTTPDGGSTTVDSGPASGDAGPMGMTDSGPTGADAGMVDAGTGTADIDAWLLAINAMEAQYCRCGYELMEYASEEECTLAHSVGPEPRACAVSRFGPYATDLGPSTLCTTMVLSNFATCVAAVTDCNATALNACEMARATAGGMCTDAGMELESFLEEVAECGRGTAAGSCPLTEVSAGTIGPAVWTGNTSEQGDDHVLSCAEGRGVPDVAIGWTAPAAGTFRFDTFGSAFDTTLAVFDSCGGTELACGEDAGDRRTSELTVTLTEGQSVIVVIDGFNSFSNGAAVLNVAME